jgi:hypothetical protein
MDDRVKTLIDRLENGELDPDDFDSRFQGIIAEIGDEARQSADGVTVKLERIDSAARKAKAL